MNLQATANPIAIPACQAAAIDGDRTYCQTATVATRPEKLAQMSGVTIAAAASEVGSEATSTAAATPHAIGDFGVSFEAQ